MAYDYCLRLRFGGVARSFLQRFSFASFSCICRHLLTPENFLYAEADAGTVAAALTRAFLLRGLCQVIAVLFAESAADLTVLPEKTLAAACRPVLMVTDAVDQDCFIVIHGDPPYP